MIDDTCLEKLPLAWRAYLSDYDKLLPFFESKYASGYSSREEIQCFDEVGTLINGSAETVVIDWLEQQLSDYDQRMMITIQSFPETMFILGNGDEKNSLIYCICRRLADQFRQSPDNSYLPLIIRLDTLTPDIHPQDFLHNRLKQFDAKLCEWIDIKLRHKIVVILDGFDEMTSDSVEKNALRLFDAVRLCNGTKLIITSRLPEFQLVGKRLLSHFEFHRVIHLSPITVLDNQTPQISTNPYE